MNAIIIKAVAGFYYAKEGQNVYECKARGVFRKNEITPLVGDFVAVEPMDLGKGVIKEIIDRKNSLERPPVANVDRLWIVVSTANPKPNMLVIDRLCAIAEDREIETVIAVNKTDLADPEEIIGIYKSAGMKTFSVCCENGEGIEQIKSELSSGINVFTGNSGVGKSSLLNLIDPRLGLKTGEISEKLGRGRHTTRHSELFELPGGGYVCDTSGFSSVDMEKTGFICKENLQFAFREFTPYVGKCKFTSCTHTCEKGCKIIEAAKNGKIPKSRHDSYVALYREAETVKDWQRK